MTEETKLKLDIEVTLKDEFFEGIICTMIEGGSNYWVKYVDVLNPDGTEAKAWPREKDYGCTHEGPRPLLCLPSEKCKLLPTPSGDGTIVCRFLVETARKIPLSRWVANVINAGGTVTVTEDEESDNEVHNLTKADLIRGIEMWVKNHRPSFTREDGILTIDGGDIDGDDADSILQYAIFGKLVYG